MFCLRLLPTEFGIGTFDRVDEILTKLRTDSGVWKTDIK